MKSGRFCQKSDLLSAYFHCKHQNFQMFVIRFWMNTLYFIAAGFFHKFEINTGHGHIPPKITQHVCVWCMEVALEKLCLQELMFVCTCRNTCAQCVFQTHVYENFSRKWRMMMFSGRWRSITLVFTTTLCTVR